MKKRYSLAFISLLMTQNAIANDTYTDLGMYLYGSQIDGQVAIANQAIDVKQSFSDVLKKLDLGAMLYAEHRNDRWFFLGDLFYVKLSDANAVNAGFGLVNVDAQIKQFLAEGFVGYRLFENQSRHFISSLDLMAGLRYNDFDINLSAQAVLNQALVGVTGNKNISWLDGVGGLRGILDFCNGWSVSALADYGKGSDSESYQLAAFANYHFDNNIKVFGGYRFYHFENDDHDAMVPVNLDLDYHGPMLGIAYRFS